MAREINRLTARQVATLKAPGRHPDGGGLYLVVDEGGAKRWAFLFRWAGRRREMGLGSVLAVELKEARDAAGLARKDLAGGRDPIVERRRRAAQGVPTFGEVADELLEEVKPSWKNAKHLEQWETSLTDHAKPIRGMAVDKVTTEDVLKVLKPIWRVIPETASRTRGRIERVLDAAKAKGLRTGDNPAAWKGNLEHLLAKRDRKAVAHHPAMPYAQAPAFMARLRERPAMAARALELLILTALRSNEVLGAKVGEFDLVGATWTVPGERMKAGREHRVPLSAPALQLVVDLIEAQRAVGRKMRAGDYLFPGQVPGKPLSAESMVTLLKDRMGEAAYSVHGFRSTFRDWAGEASSFPRELAEMALAHLVGEEVERAYARSDLLQKRRRLMDAWAGYLGRAKGGNVADLRLA